MSTEKRESEVVCNYICNFTKFEEYLTERYEDDSDILTHFYILTDKYNPEYVYIGQTKNPDLRKTQHINGWFNSDCSLYTTLRQTCPNYKHLYSKVIFCLNTKYNLQVERELIQYFHFHCINIINPKPPFKVESGYKHPDVPYTIFDLLDIQIENTCNFQQWLYTLIEDKFDSNLSIEENKKKYKEKCKEWLIPVKTIYTEYINFKFKSNMTRYEKSKHLVKIVTPIEDILERLKSIYKGRLLDREKYWGEKRIRSDTLIGFVLK